MHPLADRVVQQCTRSLLLATIIAACTLIAPTDSFADASQWSVTVTADRSSMTPGQTAWFTATAEGPSMYNSGYALVLVDDATGNTIASCGSNACTGQMSSPWSANDLENPPDISVTAMLQSIGSPSSSGGGATAEVAVNRHIWDVGVSTNAQTTGQGYGATVGSTVTFTGTAGGVSLSNTGYVLEVVEVGTGQVLCWGNPSTTCTAAKFLEWWRNSANPLSTITVFARVRSLNNPSITAGVSDTLTVVVNRYEWNVGLVASPSSVQPGQTATFTATSGSTYATGYQLVIVNDATGVVLKTCANGGTCSGSSYIGWDQNPSPQPLRIRAEVRNVNDANDIAGLAGPITIDVNKFIWGINVTSDRATMRPGETAWVTAAISSTIQNTGYYVVLVDNETNNAFKWCYSGTQCTGPVSVGWSENGDVAEKSVRAEVRDGSATPDVAGVSNAESIYVNSYWHTVSLSATPPPAAGQQWTLTATATPQISQLGYTLQIEKDGGSTVRTCSLTIACSVGAGDGWYQAVVRSGGGKSFGQSKPIQIDGSSSHSGSHEGVDLRDLAAAIGTTSALCNRLLTAPGSRFMQPPSSLTDQQRICLTAEAGGKSIHEALRLIALASGGTTVLWYLMDDVDGNLPDVVPGDDPYTDRPLPPPFLPDNFDDVVDEVHSNNSTNSLAENEMVLRNCYYLLAKAGENGNQCRTLPIFASGTLDVPEATAHHRKSILRFNPAWAALNYRTAAQGEELGPRRWYQNHPDCAGVETGVTSCDEAPFFATMQGGSTAIPTPRLKVINSKQNSHQGSKYSGFLRKCQLAPGGRFINAPMPRSMKLPTTSICNLGN